MKRIEGAHPSSPIAVFRSSTDLCLNAVFANTVATQQKIQRKDPLLIGVYDNTMDLTLVREELARFVKRDSFAVAPRKEAKEA